MDLSIKKPPLFSNRALLNLIVPIALDALLAILMGAADSVMVSSAGEAAVSAVSLVDSVNLLFLTIITGVSVGGSVIASQYVGSRNFSKANESANHILYAATGIALIFSLGLLVFRVPLLRFVFGHVEDTVFTQANTYFLLTIISYPFTAAGSVSAAILRAAAKNRQAVTITMTVNIMNIVGNAILIYGFHMGVAGAAIATTFSRVFYACAGLIFVHKKDLTVRFEKLFAFRIDWKMMGRVLKIGLTNGLENGLFHFGKILLSSLISSFGTIYIAANSVANTLGNFGWTLVGTFSTVLLTVVGQCVGADELGQARAYTKKLLGIATVFNYVTFTLVFLLRKQLVLLFNFSPEAQEVAAYYVGAGAIFTMLTVYSFAFVPVSAFRAAGDYRYATILTTGSMFVFRVGMSYLLCKGFGMGLMGVWIGMAADWGFRSIINAIRFRSNKWLHRKLI